MYAAYYEAQGAAREVLRCSEVACPAVGPGEVLVRVRDSGINPSDVKYRSGWGGLPLQFPRVIPHQDGAGEIEAVGEGIDSSRIGQRVWLYEAQRNRACGTAAEYAAVTADKAVPLPDQCTFETGAALGVPAMTAHRCLFADGPVQGQTVLVTGGGGAVGSCAIQLAKWGGAFVVATASRDDSLEEARRSGADAVINYKTEDVAERVKQLVPTGKVDRVVDVNFAANIQTSAKVLRHGGVVATYSAENEFRPTLPFYELMSKNVTLQLVLVYTMNEQAHQRAAEGINAALEAGALQPTIAQCFALDEIITAHEAVESASLVGKVLVLP